MNRNKNSYMFLLTVKLLKDHKENSFSLVGSSSCPSLLDSSPIAVLS